MSGKELKMEREEILSKVTELCKKLDDIKAGRIQCSKGVEHVVAMTIAAVKRNFHNERNQSDSAKMGGKEMVK